MICKKCGTVVDDYEKVCPNCGSSMKDLDDELDDDTEMKKSFYTENLVLGIIGIIFAILLPLITYCVSIVGLVLSIKKKDKVGIILNSIALVGAVINSIAGVVKYLKNLNS